MITSAMTISKEILPIFSDKRLITFDERKSDSTMNLLVSYSMQDDQKAVASGLTFLGAAYDASGYEIHVFKIRDLPKQSVNCE